MFYAVRRNVYLFFVSSDLITSSRIVALASTALLNFTTTYLPIPLI